MLATPPSLPPQPPAMATIDVFEPASSVRVARIESRPFGQNTYVLCRPEHAACLVVDPGFEPAAIIGWIESMHLRPEAIVVTHGHSDHIAGNTALRSHWAELPIVIGANDAAKLTDPVANLSAPFGMALVSPPADRLVVDGESLIVAGFTLRCRAIPGHSSGHVVFVLEDCVPPVVFGGDVLFREGVGRTDFPDGDFALLAAGIRRHLYSLPDESLVLPGHGDLTTVGHERRHNPFVPDPKAD